MHEYDTVTNPEQFRTLSRWIESTARLKAVKEAAPESSNPVKRFSVALLEPMSVKRSDIFFQHCCFAFGKGSRTLETIKQPLPIAFEVYEKVRTMNSSALCLERRVMSCDFYTPVESIDLQRSPSEAKL